MLQLSGLTSAQGPLTVSAVCCPPRHVIPTDDYTTFFRTLGTRFLIGGDWNAKNTAWGARLTTPKGRNLLAAISDLNCQYFRTGEPTYRPTDPNRLPNLLDFLVTRGLPATDIQVVPVFELSSDHSPIIALIGTDLPHRTTAPTLATTHTNWDMFRAYIDGHISLRLRIKESAQLDEAFQYFNTLIQAVSCYSTPSLCAYEACYHHSSIHTRDNRRETTSAWQMAAVKKPRRPTHL
jgi:hypothetical protein